MECAYHSGVDAVGACTNCGKLICAECKTVLGGKIYCNPCADKLFARTSVTNRGKTLNWFARHLNWTAVLTWVALYPINFLAGFILGLIVIGVDSYISYKALEGLGYLVGIVVGLAWILPTNGWILKRKSRSLWWLLILFVPFGWIVFLCLENRSGLIDIKNGAFTEIKQGKDETD